ncbi:hypothetical protein NDU88_003810 [Pleurodeles waltl]|uniref:Uncharacterized protein n=1 Tax=Pleurodeles waltl TaxID=8319 RepID=A0AAV7RJK8_PLEWA|nr:hypothetical protein NDU88_003810 [Pleurodeles waltl]
MRELLGDELLELPEMLALSPVAEDPVNRKLVARLYAHVQEARSPGTAEQLAAARSNDQTRLQWGGQSGSCDLELRWRVADGDAQEVVANPLPVTTEVKQKMVEVAQHFKCGPPGAA